MNPSKRRLNHRLKRVPAVFCRVSAAEAPSCLGEIISLSAHGIRFLSSTVIVPGTTLQVFPKLLRGAGQNPRSAWPREGTVSYVTRWATGEIEIGMRFIVRDVDRIAAKAIGWRGPIRKAVASATDKSRRTSV